MGRIHRLELAEVGSIKPVLHEVQSGGFRRDSVPADELEFIRNSLTGESSRSKSVIVV